MAKITARKSVDQLVKAGQAEWIDRPAGVFVFGGHKLVLKCARPKPLTNVEKRSMSIQLASMLAQVDRIIIANLKKLSKVDRPMAAKLYREMDCKLINED